MNTKIISVCADKEQFLSRVKCSFGVDTGTDRDLIGLSHRNSSDMDGLVITLYKGEFTAARRSRWMPQLMCVGGTDFFGNPPPYNNGSEPSYGPATRARDGLGFRNKISLKFQLCPSLREKEGEEICHSESWTDSTIVLFALK
uniref:Uncharacterized protein n=1 Tax=Tetranychus urticae TaxID=32264 RepID=T1KEZ0_TETUR